MPGYARPCRRHCSVTVPFRAFRILVGGTVPFRSVPFRTLVTTTATPPALTTIPSPIIIDTLLVPPSTTGPPDPPLPQRQESLPSFKKSTEPTFVWGALNGTTFKDLITHCYEKVVHWKRNMIKVPSGKSGNLFVKELTRLFQGYVSDSALQSVALKAAMVLPSLVLQKPSKKSKNHPGLITGRLKLWQEG